MKFEEEILKLSTRLTSLENKFELEVEDAAKPPVEPKADLGPVTRVAPTESVVIQSPVGTAVTEATAKSSGDNQSAGDWTQAGDGTTYPGDAAAEKAGA